VRTGTAWSRSAWLQRLGFKTGDMPPIAAAFTPTLASGDASELLPPLLAPQGWAGGVMQTRGAGNFSGFLIHSMAVGGCFVKFDLSASVEARIQEGLPAAWVLDGVRTFEVEQPGIRSEVQAGHLTASSGDPPIFTMGLDTPYLYSSVFVPSGHTLTLTHSTANTALISAIHVRDVPAGIAPD